MEKNISYPIRINKYLAALDLSTRRGADELIKKRAVRINGRIAVLGDIVNKGDKVEAAGAATRKKYSYFAYYKPRSVITHSPQKGEKSIAAVFEKKGIFPVGRLDKESEGLIILTDDGRVVKKLLSPEYGREKEYIVKVRTPLKTNFLKKIGGGVNIEGYLTKKCRADKIGDFTFKIILTEGKKHQIRRMCAAFGYAVAGLKRTRVINIRLETLKPNQSREIKGPELEKFLRTLGLKQ